MMIKFYLLFLVVLISCNEKKSSKNIITESKQPYSNLTIKKQDSLPFKDLLLLNKKEAIQKYGKPNSNKQFILDDAQGEFRNGISDLYTRKERQSLSILIDEVTWEGNKNTWVTVWYQKIEKKTIPKKSFFWKKGDEF